MKSELFENLKLLNNYIGCGQMACLGSNLCGEEKQFFKEKVKEIAETIDNMPKTYEQDGKGYNATAYLHYFTSSADWYITEKDIDTDEQGQLQAFGMTDLGDGPELGYISITELIKNGVEFDMYFKPCTLSMVCEVA